MSRLWRRHRQAVAACTSAGYLRADRLFAQISIIIHEASALRLQHWQEGMFARRGAATWVKRRCENAGSAQQNMDWNSGVAFEHLGKFDSVPAL